jgi:hypothetical protein
MSRFAHVEFANTEEALRAARHGAPYGFRYMDHLLNVDFAPWVFYFGPTYCIVHISGWPASGMFLFLLLLLLFTFFFFSSIQIIPKTIPTQIHSSLAPACTLSPPPCAWALPPPLLLLPAQASPPLLLPAWASPLTLLPAGASPPLIVPVVLVKGLDDKKIVQIMCGQQHSIVLDKEGYVRSSIIRCAS